jgi:hypothetical protein
MQVSIGGPVWAEQRISDEVVAATIDAAVKGVHDRAARAAPPHQLHRGG